MERADRRKELPHGNAISWPLVLPLVCKRQGNCVKPSASPANATPGPLVTAYPEVGLGYHFGGVNSTPRGLRQEMRTARGCAASLRGLLSPHAYFGESGRCKQEGKLKLTHYPGLGSDSLCLKQTKRDSRHGGQASTMRPGVPHCGTKKDPAAPPATAGRLGMTG